MFIHSHSRERGRYLGWPVPCLNRKHNCKTRLPPDWCSYGRYPRIWLAMECDWLVVGELKLYFYVWEPPIAWVAWKILRTLGHCVDNESMPPKFIISVFKAWALAPLQINASLCEGPVYLFSCRVILLLYKQQLETTSVIFMLWFWLILSMTMIGSSLLWITMFSQPLIFESALHLCFAVWERVSEIPPIHIASCLFWLNCWCLKLIIICPLADYAIDISLSWDLCVICLCG